MNRRLIFSLLLTLLPCVATAQAYVKPSPESAPFYRITRKDAEAEIATTLAKAGAGEHIQASLIGDVGEVLYQSDKPILLDVANLDYDARSYKWSASLRFIVGNKPVHGIPTAGRYEELVEVPVLNKTISAGDVIAEEDIAYQTMPNRRIRKDTVQDATLLIGKAPRRMISQDRPIRESEIQTPYIVKKGARVQMHYAGENMKISTIGEALEDGAKDQPIRIKNMDSGLTVQATVTGPNEVRVEEMAQVSDKKARVISGSSKAVQEKEAPIPARNLKREREVSAESTAPVQLQDEMVEQELQESLKDELKNELGNKEPTP